jgi:GTP-binding protein LepA
MEIVQERLEREYNMDLVTTAPGALPGDDDGWAGPEIDSPAKLPDAGRITRSNRSSRDDPDAVEFVGPILQLCQDKRGVQKKPTSSPTVF